MLQLQYLIRLIQNVMQPFVKNPQYFGVVRFSVHIQNGVIHHIKVEPEQSHKVPSEHDLAAAAAINRQPLSP